MSGKRPADTGSPGPRQFKQTKLNFFTSAPKSQPKAPPTIASDEGEAETPVSPTATTGDEADPKEPPQPKQTQPTQTPSNQDAKTDHKPATPQTTTTTTPTPTRIRITDRTGDLFAAPPNTVLIHACNAVGSWGGGIALAFRNHSPSAFRAYRAHCARSTPDRLVGTALLIPPPQSSPGEEGRHYIGCLFTSRAYGRARDPPERILRATGPAMRDLMRLVVEEEGRIGVGLVKGLRMCRINSGLFAVPWARSKGVIEELELGEGEVPAGVEGGVVEVVAYERE